VPDADPDPFAILGVTPEMSLDEMRQVWRKMVREYHPDAMVARGVPEEAIRLAERRMIDINRAWDEIRALRG
jgi:DnaJ like chaperone protein